MNSKSIEGYLRKMIEIDKEAIEIEERVASENEKRQKMLRKLKRETEMDIMRKARMESRQKTENYMKEAREYEQALIEQTDVEINKLKTVYNQAENDLVREIMKQIFNGGIQEV